VIEPGKQPRVTLTPTLALKDGKPFLAFAVQGGDSQDQNLLQFFLNVVEFGMTVQQAPRRPTSTLPDAQLVRRARVAAGPPAAARGHAAVGAERAAADGLPLEFEPRTSGPINAIFFDRRSTARCGAGRATTARTTASPGDRHRVNRR
jgi:gamma-glutamyltranspeptidase / glutathione hydrolase